MPWIKRVGVVALLMGLVALYIARSVGRLDTPGIALDQRGSVGAAASGDARALFMGGEEADGAWAGTPAAKRVRKLLVDRAWMTPNPTLVVGDLITLALFDDAVFSARISRVTTYVNGAVGMTAQLQDAHQGLVYLSYVKDQLTVTVEPMGAPDYAVSWRDGGHYALEVDRAQSDFLEGGDSLQPRAAVDVASYDADPSAASGMDTPTGDVVIDVMMVYTPAAAHWAGGGIASVVAHAMEKANQVHANSGTGVYLNLVYSGEISYVESSSSATDLSALTSAKDGVMDEVHALRDDYAADLVCLLEAVDDEGGRGWLLCEPAGREAYGFCVARVQQAQWTYTVVHEWGHNMGCHHSRSQGVEPGPGIYADSSGWQWADAYANAVYRGGVGCADTVGYCTIMTYQDFDADGLADYKRVPYFSNPSISYQSQAESNPTGEAGSADNARTIRSVRSVVAAYRDAPDLDYDGLPNAWELKYFGEETAAVPTALAANGVDTILDSYVAGLDPTDATATFAVTAPTGLDDAVVLNWVAVSGRVYAVQGSTNLSVGFQPWETDICWPRSSWTDVVQRAQCFYKIEVQLSE